MYSLRDTVTFAIDEFRIMPDLAARLAAFPAGQVEYAYSPVSSLNELKTLQSSNEDLQVNMVPLTYITFTIGLNLTDGKSRTSAFTAPFRWPSTGR